MDDLGVELRLGKVNYADIWLNGYERIAGHQYIVFGKDVE